MGIQEYLQEATGKGASDLFIVAGLPLTYKINRKMIRVGDRLMPEDTRKLIEDIYVIAQERKIETLEKNLKLDTDIRRQQEQCEKKIETYQKKQQTYQKGISQAYLDRVSGILTEKEYLELTEEFRQGKQQSEKLMESEKKRLTELTERLEKGDERGKRILKYINPEFLTKEIVEDLIDHIVVGKKSKETGEIPVEIHWNF